MMNILSVAGSGSKYSLSDTPAAEFFAGLWHGLLLPLTFTISLLDSDVRIYEINNSGLWYDFGFILGASSSLGGGGAVVDTR
ncbi:MAG: hypothetical protein AAGI45_14875 [Cyanobacteria bacterium P01_H01_bin.26]